MKHYLRLLLCSILLLITVTGATFATETTTVSFNEAEIMQKYAEAMFPALEQFRVTLDAYWNNQRVGYGTFGWNSGPSITGTVLSPVLHAQGALSFAFRPSGFILLKTPDAGETVIADFVSQETLIETLINVLNRDFYMGFFALAAKGMTVTGTTILNGRPAYVLESDPTQPSPAEIMDFLFSNPVFAGLLPEDFDIASLDEFYPAEVESDLFPMTTVRSYIDMQDHIPLGFDQEAFDAMWREVNSLLVEQDGMTVPQPRISVDSIAVDAEGHISAITYSFTMDWPRSSLDMLNESPVAVETQTPEDDKMVLMVDMAIEITRNAGIYLPSYFAASVTMDFSDMEVPDNTALMLNPVQTHTVELVFEWDLERGVDNALVNNPKLLMAEMSWEAAREQLASRDYNGAVASLERLLSHAPTFMEGYVMLSTAYIFSGRNEQAAALLEMLIELLPPNPWLINNLAYVYVDAEINVERGLELILQLNEDLSGEMPAGITDTLAWALYKNGKIEEAEAAMRLTLERAAIEADEDEETATMYYHFAAILYAAGKYEEAKGAIVLALQEDEATAEMFELEKRIDAALTGVTQ